MEKYGALARYSKLVRSCHNMNIIFQTTGGDAYSLNGKIEIPNKNLDNIARTLMIKSINKKEYLCLTYQYTMCLSLKNIICCVLIFHTTFSRGQVHITSTSKSGAFEYALSMGVPQETIWIIDPIDPTSCYMQLLQDLFSIGNHIRLTISTKTIKHGLMNIITVYI